VAITPSRSRPRGQPLRVRAIGLGKRLIAVCVYGPRQREELSEVCTHCIELPAVSFKQQGTGVKTAIIILDN
jgi:hypothetical protein